MTKLNLNTNPFQVKSPEDIDAHEVVDLFVPIYNDYKKLLMPENTFLNGPRGSGKSMMFRFMQPDCQCINSKCKIEDLEFLSVYIPIKTTEFHITEFEKLKDHASLILNEHILVSHFATKCFDMISKLEFQNENEKFDKLLDFYQNEFCRRLNIVGHKFKLKLKFQSKKVSQIFIEMRNICEEIFNKCYKYCTLELGINNTRKTSLYKGPICTYLNFLYPLLIELCDLAILPQKPVYLLIDDADNLSKAQTKILNTWVSYRTMTRISLKISTQLNYKTFSTISGTTIDSPHDYSEVNIDAVYTSSKKQYKENIEHIIKKRLKHFNIQSTPEDFFPKYKKQEDAIQLIYDKYVIAHKNGNGRGNKGVDDGYRYARPDYIKSLGGASKKKSKYYYAGFEQLVHLSSGIVRFFLESAHRMYGEMQKKANYTSITFIDPGVQNVVSRDYADEFYFTDFSKFTKDIDFFGHKIEDAQKLQRLINSLGGVFSAIINSNASERRVFSVALTNQPDEEISTIFALGVKWGYFQESSIGNKEGTGRTKMYILSRRLAPFFTLDPTSFAGYKFMTNDDIRLGYTKPNILIEKVRKKLVISPDSEISINKQLEIF